MLKRNLTLLALIISISISAQNLQWQNLIGGSVDERGCCLIETLDGNIVFGASTMSGDGDLPSNRGSNDIVIGKMEPDGDLLWLTTEGGSGNDWVYAIENTNDGGVLAVGFTESTNGAYNVNRGGKDGIILKFDKDGNFLWRKLIGGSDEDSFQELVPTDDGGFLLAGSSISKDGDLANHVTPQQDSYNGWLVKIDEDGNIEWQKVIGTIVSSSFNRIEKGIDGGYILTGTQISWDPNTPLHYGSRDILLTKVNEDGEVEWQQNFGGSASDLVADLLVQHGNYFVLGTSDSADNDIPSNAGDSDSALFSIDSNGNLNWVKVYGGFKNDHLEQITRAGNGNFLLSGISSSPSPPQFGYSSWLLLVDANGDKISEQFRDQDDESGSYRDMIRTQDGAFHFIGTTDSEIDNLNNGRLDIWLGRFLMDFNLIAGRVYVDLDDNGIKDATDVWANNVLIQAQQSNFIIKTNVLDGDFKFYVQSGAYVTSILDVEPYFEVPENDIISEFISLSGSDSLEFRLVPTGMIPEVGVSLFPRRAARPGFLVPYSLVISNNGNISISGEASVKFQNDKMIFIGADKPNLSSNPEVLSFDFADLKPLQQEKVNINFRIRGLQSVDFGEILTFESSIPTYQGELNQVDNIDTLYQEITGSYDPNDKTILSKNPITPIEFSNGITTKYLIRFQNTGNDTAFNIVVSDTLSDQHILETFKPIVSSHSYRTLLNPNGSLQIFYDDIQLVDSIRNEPESHGYFSFEIGLRPQVPVDSVVENTAHIYFDFNPPIVTNTTQLKIQEPTISSTEIVLASPKIFKLFPNPVINKLQIELTAHQAEEAILKVVNMEGQVVHQENIFLNEGFNLFSLNCQKLVSGNYTLVVMSKTQTFLNVFSKNHWP